MSDQFQLFLLGRDYMVEKIGEETVGREMIKKNFKIKKKKLVKKKNKVEVNLKIIRGSRFPQLFDFTIYFFLLNDINFCIK